MPRLQKDDGTNKKITQFLRQSKSSTSTSTPRSTTDIRRDVAANFYTSSATDQLHGDKCNQQACAIEKFSFEQLEKSEEKKQQTKQAIQMCKKAIDGKNAKLHSLKQQLHKQKQAETHSEVDELFFGCENDFSRDGLSALRSIGGTKTDDSKFVLTGMRFLYQGQIKRLENVSVTGASKKKGTQPDASKKSKEKMSPAKMNAVKSIYTQRLNALGLESKELKERAKRINVHINNAIHNLHPKNNKTQRLDDLNQQINMNESLMQ